MGVNARRLLRRAQRVQIHVETWAKCGDLLLVKSVRCLLPANLGSVRLLHILANHRSVLQSPSRRRASVDRLLGNRSAVGRSSAGPGVVVYLNGPRLVHSLTLLEPASFQNAALEKKIR